MEWSKDTLKQLLGIPFEDTSQDTALMFHMADVEEIVKNYCNIEEIPEGLFATCYRMIIDLYHAETIGSSDSPLIISSITEGDTATSFSSKTDLLQESVLKSYKTQLNRYRRLRWSK